MGVRTASQTNASGMIRPSLGHYRARASQPGATSPRERYTGASHALSPRAPRAESPAVPLLLPGPAHRVGGNLDADGVPGVARPPAHRLAVPAGLAGHAPVRPDPHPLTPGRRDRRSLVASPALARQPGDARLSGVGSGPPRRHGARPLLADRAARARHRPGQHARRAGTPVLRHAPGRADGSRERGRVELG